jgi:glycosyltransferase involved in cell wall biosynthesis
LRKSSSPPYTIAHILPWPAVGGTEHATLRIAQSVDPDRYKSVAFCLPDAAPVRELFASAGFPTSPYRPAEHSYRDYLSYLRASWALSREFRRQHVDLVHCADILGAWYAGLAGRLAGLPVLCHIRNRNDNISRRDASFLWPVTKFAFVSQDTWKRFGMHVPAARGTVIYDGIDVRPALNEDEHRRSVRREFGIPESAPIIGMMARVAPQKDYFTLAKAAARILPEVPDVRFLIAGDNDRTPEHREHYQKVQKVLAECGVAHAFIFAGLRDDIPRLLSAIDIFALSTHWEGLPLVILEAMAQARPVVATAVDGIPEVIEDGKTGLLFPHEDDVSLAAHLLTLLRNPSRLASLGEAGRRFVEARFSRRQFAESMNSLYGEML